MGLPLGAARAQIAPPVVTPTIQTSQIVQSGATVNVPVATNESKVRLRLRNGAAYLDEESKKREGATVSARLDAEPGLYLLRAFAPGKDARLAGPAALDCRAGLAARSGRLAFQRLDVDSQNRANCGQRRGRNSDVFGELGARGQSQIAGQHRDAGNFRLANNSVRRDKRRGRSSRWLWNRGARRNERWRGDYARALMRVAPTNRAL